MTTALDDLRDVVVVEGAHGGGIETVLGGKAVRVVEERAALPRIDAQLVQRPVEGEVLGLDAAVEQMPLAFERKARAAHVRTAAAASTGGMNWTTPWP